eukprot:CAMPEP_0119013352 /NCGR_PEP_ID=MMETSP1176-20130426/8403_1 /TAXON_ID=265551 /ORGANISM="Synedropsis recta cf, Strain CCMP1620" /LENGTH=718 /DNA_ID=CAMNT_0006966439 /DNA_START=24 /DNA_END=2180 /DNA_ORIENTATION=-
MSKATKKKGPLGLLRGKEKEPDVPNEEMEALRSQLDEEHTKTEKLLKEQELENARKEAAIRKLGDKFRRVQRGLNRMEKERKVTNSNKEKAEKENIHLRKLLHIRDKELQTFNLQTAMGEEATSQSEYDPAADLERALKGLTIPDSIDVPASVNVSVPENQVTKMMTNLELQLSLRDEHVDKLMDEVKRLRDETRDRLALERMLRESEGHQTLMKVQLDRMEDDYEQVMLSLSNCFENMKKMTSNYKMKEAERTEVVWEANRCIAEQRAAHLKNCKRMAKELFRQQVRVEELEALTGSGDSNEQESAVDDASKKTLPLEKIVLDNSRATAFTFKEMQHKKEIENLQEEIEQQISNVVQRNKQQIDNLSETLLDKEKEIKTLREEMGGHMDQVMKLSTEVTQLKESPMVIELEDKPVRELDMDQSAFSDAYDSEFEMEALSVLSDLDEGTQSTSKKKKDKKKSRRIAKSSLSGQVDDQGSVTISTRSLPPLDEEGSDVKREELVAMEKKFSGMVMEKNSMLLKLSDAGESIQSLEKKVQTEQATVGLLRTNLDMMERTMADNDAKLKELMKKTALDLFDTMDGPKVDVDAITLRAELSLLKDKLKTETAIMQEMIRVLNGQVYQAMKALEQEQQKTRSANSPEPATEVDEKVAALQRDLDSLQKKSQLALQLSQAELVAMKSKLEKSPITGGDAHTLGLDWLSARKRSPSSSPPTSPAR